MAWDTTIPVFSPTNVPNATDMNKFLNNLEYLHNKAAVDIVRNSGTNITTTSTTFTDITGYTVTRTYKTGKVLFIFMGVFSGADVFLDILIDGTSISGGNGVARTTNSWYFPVLIVRVLNVSAGSRTIKMQWKVDAGTGTFFTNSRYPYMYLRELSWTP